MPNQLRLCLALHNHQPVGNFDHVFEQAYENSYRAFLDVFEPFENIRISLHISGPLAEWLDTHHGDYLDRVGRLVQAGRIEILGGAFYESILTMIPTRDCIGQIDSYTQWLKQRLGASIRGMWVPERVWEQPLASKIANAGIDYTILDDFHFKNAGLQEDELTGYFVTEDDGRVLRIFPGNERLRYLIPFSEPHETIDFLRNIHKQTPHAVLVFGDDGEKFGTWPETKKHVYENGWLHQFFEQLDANQEWLTTTTLSEARDNTAPLGKVYLPEGSYREMTEWALPVRTQVAFEQISHDMHDDDRWPRIKNFIRGGFWRNFKVKYPETDEMYARMMMVSQRLQTLIDQGVTGELINSARRKLYRGQCNCGYWHGAFGGVYLPHLRNAIFNHLIAADNLMDQAIGKDKNWIDASAGDFNLDGLSEVSLANRRLACLLAPSGGGHLYELDVRSICHNLLATLTRREEAYHEKVRQGPSADADDDVTSIHDRVVCKQEGLRERLQFDTVRRKSLVDHFYDEHVAIDEVARGTANELGDFATGDYDAKSRKNPNRIQVQLYREGRVGEHKIRLTKGVTLSSDSATLEIAYLLEGLPADESLHFGVEMNFAGMPADADDRFFYHGNDEQLGHLGKQMALTELTDLGLVDQWLGLDVQLTTNQPTDFWTYPVETVSQSESGFELVHQSVVVHPHWFVQGDDKGRWSVKMRLTADTSLAESRRPRLAEAALS